MLIPSGAPLPFQDVPVRLVTVGDDAVLVEVGDPSIAAALAAWVRAGGVPAAEVVPAATTVLLDGVDPDVVRRALRDWGGGGEVPQGPLVTIPVSYDGPDLGFVARWWACTEDEVVRRHTSVELVAMFCGFMPGFAYLAGLPDGWAVPRLESPRQRVPAGAVALADTWAAVYPRSSPGGWRVIGTTSIGLWDTHADPPALLAPGTRVRFEVA